MVGGKHGCGYEWEPGGGGGGGGGGTTKVRAVSESDSENNKAPRIGVLAGARSVVALKGEDGPCNAPGVKTLVGASGI